MKRSAIPFKIPECFILIKPEHLASGHQDCLPMPATLRATLRYSLELSRHCKCYLWLIAKFAANIPKLSNPALAHAIMLALPAAPILTKLADANRSQLIIGCCEVGHNLHLKCIPILKVNKVRLEIKLSDIGKVIFGHPMHGFLRIFRWAFRRRPLMHACQSNIHRKYLQPEKEERTEEKWEKGKKWAQALREIKIIYSNWFEIFV